MENVVEVAYERQGTSTNTNALGMREMQARAYEHKTAQYLLLKAPPASGKSRALMFIALDKLANGVVDKVVVAVPERAIGASFKPTELRSHGFFADWEPDVDLIVDKNPEGKVDAFVAFMKDPDRKILLCSHATLRFAFEQLDDSAFDRTLLAVDEFHHVSADSNDNKLGGLIHSVLTNSSAHMIAMTGSYFRGDGVAVLLPEDEAKFEKVTYDYYDQLNGYKYLKSLGIGFHFYQGRYTDAIGRVLDTDKKTLIHIPNVNSRESTGDKYEEVDRIIDVIGDLIEQDEETGIYSVKRKDGKVLKVANLVEDDPKRRDKTIGYLRRMSDVDDVDIIIALGMAKEGFDWPFCETALTVGYRGSLTEVVQIIGRCTRDSYNKTHAQYTNLIAQPDAEEQDVTVAANDTLKAISCSLLMEQVLAPSYKFKTKVPIDRSGEIEPGTIVIGGFKASSTERTREIIKNDLKDLVAKVLQEPQYVATALSGDEGVKILNEILIPKVVRETYPYLVEDEVEGVRQAIIVDNFFKNVKIQNPDDGNDPNSVLIHDTPDRRNDGSNEVESKDRRFIEFAGRFINVNDLTFDLISSINPFQRAYEILSKTLDKRVFSTIRDHIAFTRIPMDSARAQQLFPEIVAMTKRTGKEPNLHSQDFHERELAVALRFLRELKAKKDR